MFRSAWLCCVAVAMATTVEVSDVAMRYVTGAEGFPPPTKILPVTNVSCFLGA